MLVTTGRTAGRGAVAAALIIAFAGLWAGGADASSRGKKVVRAKAFRSCQGLVHYARRNALTVVEPGRLVSTAPILGPAVTTPGSGPVSKHKNESAGGGSTQPGGVGFPQAVTLPSADANAGGTEGAPEHSTTNVQEAGVDEPDIVKTDGLRLFAIDDGKLRAVELAGGSPRVVGSLALQGSGQQLLLRGDRLLVISNGYTSVAGTPAYTQRPQTTFTEVDVSNPAAMQVTATMAIDGVFVSARLNGATARTVTTARPNALEAIDATAPADRYKTRRQLRRSQARHWLPSYTLRTRKTGRTAKRRAAGCRTVRHANSFAGLDTLTVLTIDLDKGLTPVDSDTLLTDARTVYASAGNLYVATPPWLKKDLNGLASGQSTEIHRFDISRPDGTAYRGSGKVPGFLLNQFAMSEYRGNLRVASTVNPLGYTGIPSAANESSVTVLGLNSGSLDEVGRVGGLGHGERIYSVRFIDDVGYVVTFRKVDPLYTVDLSTPSHPKVLGELKMLGYSAYLHPVGRDLLVGIGQDATDDQGGFSWYLGTQISLFDVSDLHHPTRLAQRTLAPRYSHSEVEDDHHAFLYWPGSNLAVVPLSFQGGDSSWWNQFYGDDKPSSDSFAGAIGFHVGREKGIEEVGRVTHENADFMWPVRRAIVVGDRLFTVSDQGVEASKLDTLTELAWAPFE